MLRLALGIMFFGLALECRGASSANAAGGIPTLSVTGEAATHVQYRRAVRRGRYVVAPRRYVRRHRGHGIPTITYNGNFLYTPTNRVNTHMY